MSETTLQMISEIINVCIIPLLGVLVTYLVKFINAKSKELEAQTDSAIAKKYISMLSNTITSCVIATNQTYVESLKKQGKFDAEAQKEAFQMTLNAVLAVLNDEAKEYYNFCHTFVAFNVQWAVQGTSSQYYPRRNWKGTFKTEKKFKEDYVAVYGNATEKCLDVIYRNITKKL